MAVFGRVLDGLSGLAGIFINYIYTRCGKIQDLYFSTPIYKKLEKPVPTCQVLHCVKKHLRFGSNVLVFEFERTCVLNQSALRFRLNELAF